jgi:hypothetical protein
LLLRFNLQIKIIKITQILEVSTFVVIFAAIFMFTILGDEWDKFTPPNAIEKEKTNGHGGGENVSPRSNVLVSDSSDTTDEKNALLGSGGSKKSISS